MQMLHFLYKVSKRRELDISAISSVFALAVNELGEVTHVRLAYGGMAATPFVPMRRDRLRGQLFTESLDLMRLRR